MTSRKMRRNAKAELARMDKKPKKQTRDSEQSKSRPVGRVKSRPRLRLHEVERFNPIIEKWEDVVTIAPTRDIAERKVRSEPRHIKRIEDFT
jgi:hypothetical protein